jgi:uncharacterized protein (TIGR00255 family)
VILSMTAFGRSRIEALELAITVEIRALNSRNLDIVLRLPKNAMEFEDHCRKAIAQTIRRGRVEVAVQIETKSAWAKAPRLNLSLAAYYWEQLQELHRRLPQTDPPALNHLLAIPYLFEPHEATVDLDSLRAALSDAISEALHQVEHMKIQEGKALLDDCLNRIASVQRELSFIEDHQETILADYQQRLRDRIQALLGETTLDESRLLQEVALVAERSDINEEMVRLRSHLEQMQALLAEAAPVDGRRLDFLTQEMHREVNTIGSKTGDLGTVRAVIAMKTEIGKLKEQFQNVE